MNDYELIRILPDVKDDEAWQEVMDLAKEQVREGGKKLELVIGAARQSTDLLAERDKLLELLQYWYVAQIDSPATRRQAEDKILTFFGEGD